MLLSYGRQMSLAMMVSRGVCFMSIRTNTQAQLLVRYSCSGIFAGGDPGERIAYLLYDGGAILIGKTSHPAFVLRH